jgi:hypothetical protein
LIHYRKLDANHARLVGPFRPAARIVGVRFYAAYCRAVRALSGIGWL